jgi:AraC-like DNA-binding protein
LRKLHAQSRVLDFMVALHQHFAGPLQQESSRRRTIQVIRRELDQLNGHLPSLAKLASRHALSERQMCQAFRQEYGQSIYAYITDLRLQAAHAALTASETPLKVLAARLGYSSVHHFSNAFTRRFGYRPGQLRRKT